MLLLLLPLLLAPQHPVAVLRSGDRVPCTEVTQVGDYLIETPYGRLAGATDPVVELVDPAKELQMLAGVRQSDFSAWVERVSARGMVGELLRALESTELAPADRDQALRALEDWGRLLDPLPRKLEADDRVDWLWKRLEKADDGRGALLTGRLLAEIPAGNAPVKQRVGLADLRRALRGKDPLMRRAAAEVALHQLETDLVLPLAAVSLEEKDPQVHLAAARSLLGIDEDRALGRWTLALLRGEDADQRIRAAENLGRSNSPKAVAPLMMAVASASRSPGRFVFFGRQISLVTDFDVEVASAAAIANPVTSVVSEGQMLEVRLVSTFVSRSAMQGLRRLTGADPGPAERDWIRWYEEQQQEN